MTVPKEDCIDLLFYCLQKISVIIPHTQVITDIFVFGCRNIHSTAATIGQALCSNDATWRSLHIF